MEEKTDWEDILPEYKKNWDNKSIKLKNLTYKEWVRFYENLKMNMLKTFGYRSWMNHIPEIARDDFNNQEGGNKMNKTEREELKKAKANAKAKKEEIEETKIEKKNEGFTRTRNNDLKKEVFNEWEKNKDKKPKEIAKSFPTTKPGTIGAWISAWKNNNNLPK